MSYMIAGVAMAGLGLLVASISSRRRSVRIAAACSCALGVLLVLRSWTARTPPTNQEQIIRSGCRSAAMTLQSFDTRRLASPQIWTREQALHYWHNMTDLLSPVAGICIDKPSTCDRPRITNPYRATFSAELEELTDAIRTGKSCTP